MITGSAPRPGVGRAPLSAAGRRPINHKADQLERLSSRLDELIRDVRLGSTSHRQTERMIGEAEDIAAGIRGLFRTPSLSGKGAQ